MLYSILITVCVMNGQQCEIYEPESGLTYDEALVIQNSYKTNKTVDTAVIVLSKNR